MRVYRKEIVNNKMVEKLIKRDHLVTTIIKSLDIDTMSTAKL